MAESANSIARGFSRTGALISVRTLTGSGTYTPGSGVQGIDIICIGDGGGGGSVTGVLLKVGAGSGGQSGAWVRMFMSPLSTNYSYACGPGGTGDGTGTTFGSLSAPGGKAGTTVTADSGVVGLIVGAVSGNIGTGGDWGAAGSWGSPAINMASLLGLSAEYMSGGGAHCPLFGVGGAPIRGGSSNGNDATGYGAGGGGATTNSTTSRTGGAGAPGVIKIFEYS